MKQTGQEILQRQKDVELVADKVLQVLEVLLHA